MARYLQFVNWKTDDRADKIDVTEMSERQIEKIERGMLINCDVEGGWFVDDFEEPAS